MTKQTRVLIVLAGVLLMCVANPGFVLGADDGQDLVGWWKMEGSSWAGKTGEVKDLSGRGNDLTAYGKGEKPGTVPIGKAEDGGAGEGGKTVRAAAFKSSESQYLAAAVDNEDLCVGWEDFTLTAWVKSTDLTRRCSILGYQACDYGSCNYGFYQRDQKFYLVLNGPNKGERWPVFMTRPISRGWAHLAGVRQGDKLHFYVNGRLNSTREGVAVINPDREGQYFVIGARMSGKEHFDGLIADVKLYKRALTPEQVAQEYDRLKDTFPQAQEQERVVYEQGFEQLAVGAKTGPGMSGNADMDITEESHHSSTRALRVTYHPESEANKMVYLSPVLTASLDCTHEVSVRVKLEGVSDPKNRKWLYPYIRVNVYDAGHTKTVQCPNVVYSVTSTKTQDAKEDDWMTFKMAFTPQEGACDMQLVMYVYEGSGVTGRVYVDDIKIVEKYK